MPRGRLIKKQISQEKRSSSAPQVMESPSKWLKWTNQSMVAAMKAVVEGNSSINKAATEYNYSITGKVLGNRTKPRPKPYLDKIEEKELAEFLQTTAEMGYGKTRKQVMNIVESTAREKGLLRKRRISDSWFWHFIERQPQLSLHKGDSTAFLSMDSMKRQQELDNYYHFKE